MRAKKPVKELGIMRHIHGKKLSVVIGNLQELLKEQGDGKIKIEAKMTGGPLYYRQYNGKIKVSLEIPDGN